jgi:hypothetical protein
MPKIKKFIEFSKLIENQILLEKTFDIDADVDYIFEKSKLGEFIDDVLAGKKPYENELYSLYFKDVVLSEISSSELSTDESIRAHEINPIKIFLGVSSLASYYKPLEHKIFISLNPNALFVMYQEGGYEELSDHDKEIIKYDLTHERVQTTIAHELSHWISDTLYNKHIERIIKRANELSNIEIMNLKQKNVNMTYFEIDAQIHGIKSLKRKFSNEEWDNLTLRDLMFRYPSLITIYKVLKSKYDMDVVLLWQKNLVKRMYRENLLGKNMKSFITEDF